MQQLNLIGRFLWPYRKRLLLSMAFAILVSMLWATNLSATYPAIEVLFGNQSLHTGVDSRIGTLQDEIETFTETLGSLDAQQLSERARMQRKLNEASHGLVFQQWLKDSVLPLIPDDRFKTMLVILVALIFATALKGCATYAQDLLVGSVVHSSANDIRAAAFGNTLDLDYQFLCALGSAQLTSRLTNGVTELSHGLRLFCVHLVREPLKIISCLTAAMIFNWRLTIVSLLVMPLIGVLFYRSGRVLRSAARDTMETMTSIYQRLTETFDSTRVVVAFDGKPHHERQLRIANDEYFGNSMRMVRISALIRPVTELLAIVAFTGVLLPGAYMVLNNTDQIFGVKLRPVHWRLHSCQQSISCWPEFWTRFACCPRSFHRSNVHWAQQIAYSKLRISRPKFLMPQLPYNRGRIRKASRSKMCHFVIAAPDRTRTVNHSRCETSIWKSRLGRSSLLWAVMGPANPHC